MTSIIDYEFLQSITWYAVDLDRQIAAFDSGSLPTSAFKLVSEWNRVDQVLRELPELSAYRLFISRSDIANAGIKGLCRESKEALADALTPTRERMASELPRCGVYQFVAVAHSYGELVSKYRLACAPISPISLESLPANIREVVGMVVAPVRFSEVQEVDVEKW